MFLNEEQWKKVEIPEVMEGGWVSPQEALMSGVGVGVERDAHLKESCDHPCFFLSAFLQTQ